MKCPYCGKAIDDKLINKHFASKGGLASKRNISAEAQKKMQEGKRANKKAAPGGKK